LYPSNRHGNPLKDRPEKQERHVFDLDDVHALIESHEGRSLSAYAALDELCSRMPAASLIEMLLDSSPKRPAEVAECARRSYRHALGFEKIMLMVGARSSTLRVHVWRPGTSPAHAAEHVHNHRFEFASAVLYGSMAMETFAVHPRGAPMSAYAESIGADGETWIMQPQGSERLRKTMDLRLAAGTLYQMDAESLHRTANDPSACTVTLFLEASSRRGRPRTDVYTRNGAGVPASFRRNPMRPDEYLVALAEVRSLLAGVGAS
jgi:hypothetical protein